MKHLLETIGRHSAMLLVASIVVGIALPDLAELFRPLLAPAVYGLLALAMTRIDILAVRGHLRSPARIVLPLMWMNLALPLAIGAAVTTFAADLGASPGLIFALVLIASAPPITAASAISYLLGLDGALSLALLLIATALTPLVTPLMVHLWMGPDFAISPVALGLRLGLLIGGSWIVAFAVRRYFGRPGIERNQGVFDGLNVILLVVFAIGLMSGIGARFLADPAWFLTLVAIIFAITLGMTAVTTALFWRFSPRLAGTIGYATGFRNIALAIGALGGAVPADTWTMFAVIQFPIYLSPLMLGPACRWLLGRRSSFT
jgi:BASS family bile acid:Na+ symporter